MPYLPIIAPEETSFPKADTRDLAFQIRAIEELYRRQAPAILYYQLNKAPTPTTTPAATQDRTPVGDAGTTKFDPIWGEVVADTAEWVQPQGTAGAVSPNENEVFFDPVRINARVQRISKETELKKYGFDKVRDLTLFVPLSILDTFAITVTHGDKFVWNGDEYTVLELNLSGYWKNTDVSLYMAINAEHRRKGS